MRKLIVAGIAFVLLFGGYIVYMEIDKRKFIDSLVPPSPIVNRPANVSATTREVTQADEGPKFQEVDPAELLDAVNRVPEQFGYSDASITYAKLESKVMSGEKLTLDERVASLEATLRLWPNEATRRSLILAKWLQSKGPNFPTRDGYSDEDLAELKELGIPVVYRGDAMIINPRPDYIRDEEPSAPASDTVFSEGIGEDTVSSPARSELSVTPEYQELGTPAHIYQEEGPIHEAPTSPTPPVPTAEDSGGAGLSKVQQELVKQFFDEYGTEEGLRQLRKMDPDTAERFERERGRRPARDAPSGHTHPDGQSHDSAP